ncbi:DNA repair protein [Microthyrium microscopicum]|uniref:DNA repair protein REV1 n=1 Tax=Microthyrium microscopicum TaxID=703497 RepID=A0A6A6UHI7_9PEZI|nr:DNA repair protein [Microthyrium microscopicum]
MGSLAEKNSSAVKKRIQKHKFDDEGGEEYEGSEFGGFPDYFRRKKIKLQNLDAELRETSHKPKIFRGTVIHINGYTQPSLNDLHKLVVSHGGGFLQYLDGKTMVTHVIASNLTPKKAAEFEKYRIVKPAWIVDSVKAGRLLPWNSYRVIDAGPAQKVLGFEAGKIVNQESARKKGYGEQTEAGWYINNLNPNQTSRTSSERKFVGVETSSPFSTDDDIFDYPEVDNTKKSHRSPSTPLTPSNIPALEEQRQSVKRSRYTTDQIYDDFDDLYDCSFENMEKSENNDELDEVASQIQPKEQTPVPAKEIPNPKRKAEQEEGEAISPKRAKLTAEQHNALLLADPQIRKSTVVNPGFLEQYYRESRLHHLSTWKSDLKSEMQAWADKKTSSQNAKQTRPPGSRRYILHVDFDCFFAAVSLKKRPDLKDKPVVVAHGNGTGSEIASCNYVARGYGVKNGMWMKKALDLCPTLQILSYDFPAYEEASRAFYEIVIATGGIVQSVSIDEALVDVSTLCFSAAASDGKTRSEGTVDREQTTASSIGQKVRDDIKAKTGFDVSVGIGGNILQAKLALRKAKPAGLYHLMPEDVLGFIGGLEVQNLPGVAWSTGGKLEELGIKLIKDVRETSKERLMNTLGPKTGEKLWEYARGIDRKEVGDIELRKSVSAEVNWGVRFENQQQVDEFFENLCGEVQRRLLKEGVRGKQLTLKIMRRAATAPLDPPKHLGHGKCDTFSKAIQLGVATNSKEIMLKEILSLLKSFGFSPGELRGIGIQMTKLESAKSGIHALGDGSQRVLQFKPNQERLVQAKITRKRDDITDDPIEDAVTPKKQKLSPERVLFGAPELNQNTPSKKPLNTMGTQFLLPTQVDSQVLRELPSDIRSKLLAASKKGKSKIKTPPPQRDDGLPAVLTALPAQSQIDPGTFNALPPDMQQEIMAFYKLTPGFGKTQQPSVNNAPPKPIKIPSIFAPKDSVVKGKTAKAATLTQHNFITNHFRKTTPDIMSENSDKSNAPVKRGRGRPRKGEEVAKKAVTKPLINPDLVGIDPEYLAALPPEFQNQVILGNRVHRIHDKNVKEKEEKDAKEKARVRRPKEYLHLPQRQPRPSFTKEKLSTLPKLRRAVSQWVDEFRDDGPYPEDTEALGKYLTRVVNEEHDMSKSLACFKWLKWVIEEELDEKQDAVERWNSALDTVGVMVQEAVKQRGLGRMPL